jgi:four helix bundle protein
MGQADDLYNRTKMFAMRIVRLFQSLPKTEEARLIGRQLLRSGTSVPANYRAARRARSRAEFIAKLGVVVEETDESAFWLEFLVDTEILREKQVKDLLQEAGELLKIFSTSRRTAKIRHSQRKGAIIHG